MFTSAFGDQLVIEYDFFVSVLLELLPFGILPFQAGAGATTGTELAQKGVLNSLGDFGDEVGEIIPLEIFDK